MNDDTKTEDKKEDAKDASTTEVKTEEAAK